MQNTRTTRVALEAQLARFPPLQHACLQQCAQVSHRVAELAASNPLLFCALATHYGPLAARLEAVRLAELGRPLTEVSRALDLPNCLRRIPPEACIAPLPYVRWSPDAARLLGPQVPGSAPEAARWLKIAFYSARSCHETFALWMCKRVILDDDFDPALLRPLAMFAWHSRQPENPLQRLAIRPWSPRMGLGTAVREAKLWFNRVKLFMYFHQTPLADAWVCGGSAGGFDFVPLLSCQAILDEGTAMRNCLHSYADRLARNACRLFSVRQGGRRIATLELAPPGCGDSSPRIAQIKGPENTEPPRAVRRASKDWLKAGAHRALGVATPPVSRARAEAKFAAVMQPYWTAVGAEASSRPDHHAELGRIELQLSELGRWARVSAWPYRR